MANGKKYYWMKLKDSFMTSDVVDYFMEQKDGANYVVLYQILCLKTINTHGRLQRQIGEVIIPYDVEKIQRDCKWFPVDTVRVALELFKRFGLIYEDNDGVLTLADHENLVGSATDYADQKRRQRSLPASQGEDVDNVHPCVHANVHTDIDIRDRESEIDKESEKEINIDSTTVEAIDTSSVDVTGPTPPTRGDVRNLIEAWNALGIAPVEIDVDPQSDRAKAIREAVNTYGMDKLLEVVSRCRGNTFLSGGGNRGWKASFDWVLKNAGRILEGAFDEYKPAPALPEQKPNKAALQKSSAASPGELEMQMVRRLQEDLEESDGMA